ncbi:MAG TPA: hypothetical protein VEL31_31445 [Ktedonobacteraceae bacterium]|nr:hypothetical protein [Ktedonobacteraceae bacterium]
MICHVLDIPELVQYSKSAVAIAEAGNNYIKGYQVDITPIAYYDWRFQVQKQYGLFVITSLGLYPTGSQNQ